MAWFARRSRGRLPYRAVTDEERVSRYVYLLNTLPESVIEKAHASAFKELPLDQRQQMFDELRPFMSEAEQKKAPQPALLAQVLGRATAERRAGASVAVDERDRRRDESDAAAAADPMVFVNSRLATSVAIYFLASHAVSSYFTVGAGSLAISSEPGWVGELGGVDVGGADGGYGGGYGGGFDGGGFDGGGFGDFGGGGDIGGF